MMGPCAAVPCLLLLLFAAVYTGAQEEGEACRTPRGAAGACANIRTCPPLLQLLRAQRNQPGAADYLRQSLCSYAGLDPIVCCPLEADDQQRAGSTTTTTPAPAPAPSPAPVQECGFSNVSHSKVVGGVPSLPGAWPWMVALGYKPSPRSASREPRFLCGAALVSTRHVLTAAHCVYSRSDLYFVRLGAHDLEADAASGRPVLDVPIKERRVHGGYDPKRFVNDIALLVLDRDVPRSPNIHPICLPNTPTLRSKDLVGTRPFIAGWGAKHFNGPSSSELLELQIPVVTQEKCRSAFERFGSAVIDERVLCAGFDKGGKDACQGDSGGPLMAPQGTTYYQIGVVSYGYRCAEPGVPGVYTRVTTFLDWLEQNMKET